MKGRRGDRDRSYSDDYRRSDSRDSHREERKANEQVKENNSPP